MIKRLKRMAATVLAACLCWSQAVPAAAESLAAINGLEVSPDQVTISLSASSEYRSFATADPPRLIVDILDAEYQGSAKAFAGQGHFLKGVRAAQYQRSPRSIARIVLDLSEKLTEKGDFSIERQKNNLWVRLGPAGGPKIPAPAAHAAIVPKASPNAIPKPSSTDVKKDSVASAELMQIAQSKNASNSKESSEADLAADADSAAKAEKSSGAKKSAWRGDILARLPRDPISIDFEDTDIKDIIKIFAAKANFNIIYGSDVSGTLSLHLNEVPFNEAFRTVLSMMGLQTAQVGEHILRVLTPAAMAKTQTAAATATRVIPLNYTKAADILSTVNAVRSAAGRSGTAQSDTRTNSLIITESPEGLQEAERLIADLDVRPQQVLIEAKLVEVNLSNSLNYGIQWDYQSVESARMGGQNGTNMVGTLTPPNNSGGTTLPLLNQNGVVTPGVGASGRGSGVNLLGGIGAAAGAFTFGRITNNYFLTATLAAAAAQGKVKVLSDPKIATLNNQAANINVTTQIPYVTANVNPTGAQTQTVTYLTTGIQLSVTPTINADGRITLQLNPNVSQPSATSASNAAGAPAVDSRNAQTTVLVRDGDTIVIGGLIYDSMSDQIFKVPLLGDIPILGWLFKKKSVVRSRLELLIFVTPKILQD